MQTVQPSPAFAVQMRGICKRFAQVLANQDVSIAISAGSIYGIVGENGAGKSTLMSILYGFYQADSGTIRLFGEDVAIKNSTDAIKLGIGMVHQHFMLVDKLSALENILLGSEGSLWLEQAKKKARQHLQGLMDTHHLHVRLDELVENMPVGEQQRLEILKALHRGARILILDEPTGVLTPQEVDDFFKVLRELRTSGVTVIIITHKLHEIMELTDAVTVMRNGRVVAELATASTNRDALAELMVGRPIHTSSARKAMDYASSPLRLQVDGLCYQDERGITRVNDVSFDLRAGEILGVAGVSGNGQSELLALLAGLLTPSSGSMGLNIRRGQTEQKHHFTKQKWLSSSDLRKLGAALVPEDRLGEGVIKNFAMQESAILGYDDLPELGSFWHLSPSRVKTYTEKLIQAFDVRPNNPLLRTANMSGGNQQKLILAREMTRQPQILIIGQPTRGVDIGAIEQIYTALLSARDAGAAILVVSVELEEILALSDRVMVMNQGAVTGFVEQVQSAATNGVDVVQSIGRLMTQQATTTLRAA